jgi:hypothetical protein
MLFDGDLLLDMEMTIYEDLMVKCGGFSVTLSGSHFHFRTPFTSVSYLAHLKKVIRRFFLKCKVSARKYCARLYIGVIHPKVNCASLYYKKVNSSLYYKKVNLGGQ